MKKNCGYLKNAISIFISIQAFLFFFNKAWHPLTIHCWHSSNRKWLCLEWYTSIMHTVQCLYMFTI